jgi:dTMP kinase
LSATRGAGVNAGPIGDLLFSPAASSPGMFATVDGPNGSGKSTLTSALARELDGELAVHLTCQPSRTPLGELVRDSGQAFHGRALACLVAADRHRQLESEIIPALEAGALVLCDRYVESSLVLQALDGVRIEDILAMNRGVQRPDVRFRLNVDAAQLQARLAARPDSGRERFERAPDAAARELCLYERADRLLAERYGTPSVLLDTGTRPVSELARTMAETVRAHLWSR